MSAVFSLLAQLFIALHRSGGLHHGLKTLQELGTVRDKFFIDLSHEMKTPLTIMKSNWEVLAGKRAGDRSKALALIGATTDRMSRMVDSYLAAARLDFVELELDKTEIALPSLLAEVYDDCATLADNGGIHLTWASDEINILVDRDRIKEVVLNLVSNALKHTEPGGAITLSGKAIASKAAQRGGAEIVVRDTGSGIPLEALPHIFERFYRIRADATPGTGLGLNICKKIIVAHGGTVSVQSKPDEGTRFVIFLP